MAIDRESPRVVLRGDDGIVDAMFYKTPLEVALLRDKGIEYAGRHYEYVGCKDGEFAFVVAGVTRGDMSEKRYRGTRVNGRCRVLVEVDGDTMPLRHVVVHSPTGFEWGYAGSGPADLALSILADMLDEQPADKELYTGFRPCPDCGGYEGSTPERVDSCSRCDAAGELVVMCMRYHQRFNFDFIAKLDRDEPWAIEATAIEAWLAAKGVELDGAAA